MCESYSTVCGCQSNLRLNILYIIPEFDFLNFIALQMMQDVHVKFQDCHGKSSIQQE
jgi:hypothetical protein